MPDDTVALLHKAALFDGNIKRLYIYDFRRKTLKE